MPTRSSLIDKSDIIICGKMKFCKEYYILTEPQGDSQDGSPDLLFFHKAKSLLFFFPSNLLPKLHSPSSINPSFPANPVFNYSLNICYYFRNIFANSS